MDYDQPLQPIRVHTNTAPTTNSNLKRTWIRRSDYFSMYYCFLLFINILKIDQLASIAHTQSRALSPDLKFKGLEDFNQEFPFDFYPDWSRYSELSASFLFQCRIRMCISRLRNPGITKLACILFARELQKRLDKEKIPILSIPIHPGEINTFGDRTPWPFLANIVMELFFMRPEPGSYTSCFAAASPLVKNFPDKYKHAYLEPVGNIGEMSANAKRNDLAADLWETTERILCDLEIDIPSFNS